MRGVVPTSQKRPPPSRGLRPASHRNAGQCPNGGGDARRKAENRARQIRGKLVWHRTAALGFGRLRRPRRPRPRGKSVGNAKHTSTADGHTLKGDRPRRGRIEAQSKAREGQPTRRGRGWKSQSRPLEERGRTTQRPRAEGQRTIQPTLGTTLALAPRRGGSGIGKAFERRADTPNAAPRARRGNDFHWTLGGLFSRNAPSGAGRGAEVFFLCRCFSRDKGGAIPTGQGPSRPDGRFAAGPGRLIYLQPANIGKLLWSPRPVVVSFSSRGAAARRALSVSSSTPIYPFYIGRPAAPPRHETQLRANLPSAVASASTLACKQSYQHRAVSGPLWVGPPTARR